MAGRPPLWRVRCFSTGFHQNNLTTSQKRVWFIAWKVQDYAGKAPAGLVFDSQMIAKVMAAEGTKPHTQTVARIMDFLEKLGKDDVEQTKRCGKKFIVTRKQPTGIMIVVIGLRNNPPQEA